MNTIKIEFDESTFFINEDSRATIKEIVRCACLDIFKDINLDKDKIILSAEEIMPKVYATDDSIHIDITYGNYSNDCIRINQSNYSRNEVKAMLFHELYHIYDRFDPDFGLNTLSYLTDIGYGHIKEKINNLWDVYIDSRIYYIYNIVSNLFLSEDGEISLYNIFEEKKCVFDSKYYDELFNYFIDIWYQRYKIDFKTLEQIVNKFES